MRLFRRSIFPAVLAANVLSWSFAWSLTIYRIGGDALSHSEEAESDEVVVVPLSWEEFARGPGGQMEGLEVKTGRLRPKFITPDENLALAAANRGGGPFGVRHQGEAKADFVDLTVDGDPTTALSSKDLAHHHMFTLFVMDLGVYFPVNRVRFYPTPQSSLFIERFDLRVYQGDNWKLVRSIRENREQIVDISLSTQYIQRFRLSFSDNPHPAFASLIQPWEIAEFEVYGHGYVLTALYRSRVFELESASSLGELRFSGFKDRDAKLRIRTRTGSDEDPNRYWRFTGRGEERSFRNDDGQPLTLTDYNNLQGGKGGITTDLDHWSSWSGPYDLGDSLGTPITSPSPRQFFQLQLDFVPSGLDGAGVDFIEFYITSPPVVGQVVGEIWPAEVMPGQETPFVYAMLPTFFGGESGFDRIVLETTGQFTGVDSVRINEERLADDEWALLEPLADQRMVLGVPRMDRLKSGRLVEVFFRGRVYHFGTVFSGQVFDRERPLEVGQFVEDGDATFRLDSNQRFVGIELGDKLVSEVAVHPRIFTPNGDGTNDQVRIEYTMLKLAGAGEVKVDIFNLAGRRVRRVYQGEDSSGQYGRVWDGLGDDGRSVLPGLYLYRVQVDADGGREERSGLIPVVQ